MDLKVTQAPGRTRGAQIHRGRASRPDEGTDPLGMCVQTHTGGFKHREELRAIKYRGGSNPQRGSDLKGGQSSSGSQGSSSKAETGRGELQPGKEAGLTPYPPSRDSSESCRRHCTCPVLWAAQLIHSPSWSPTAVMMASPAYELCLHCGSTAAASAATHPARATR